MEFFKVRVGIFIFSKNIENLSDSYLNLEHFSLINFDDFLKILDSRETMK